MKMPRPNKRGFVWTFLADDLIAYRFADNRSGETPLQVLGGTTGTLVIDGYTGYSRVTDVDGRDRVGCLAHVPTPNLRCATDSARGNATRAGADPRRLSPDTMPIPP
jgi:hypothetical protein